jgi:hypothetical protein
MILLLVVNCYSQSKSEFGLGNWSLMSGVQQEASFGTTFNVNLSYLGLAIKEDWFVEVGGAAGFFRIDNRSEIQRVRWYENDLYFNADFSLGYFLAGYNKKIDSNFRPYLSSGVSGTYVGDKYQLGANLGLGALSYFNKKIIGP